MVLCGALVEGLADDFEGVGIIGVEGLAVGTTGVEGLAIWLAVPDCIFEDTKIKVAII